MKPVVAHSAQSGLQDIDKTESDGRHRRQSVAPLAITVRRFSSLKVRFSLCGIGGGLCEWVEDEVECRVGRG